ncbi:MAG: hypothetical protein DRJ39_02005 [Thermoprotei archaeon]|nr:MAG: hypothetical protein DRJ39_02005 [Thermoprotei archaeon]
MLLSRLYIGTSGWDYDDWIGPFYAEDKRLFSQYYEIFNTVEINSTFYSYPTLNFMKGLARIAPWGFKFSAKIPKEITHKKKVNTKLGVENDLNRFLGLLQPLKSERKLGALLIQLPPLARNEIPYFEDFLNILPSNKYRFSIEFRHDSWLCQEIYSMLEKYNIAFTIVDEPLLPPIVKVTAGFAYIRWHGRGERPWYYYMYTLKELEEWVPRIKEIMNSVGIVFGYFNNHFRGYAPRNALQMLSLLGLINKSQRLKLQEIDYYFSRKAIEITKEKAKKITPEKAELEELLLLFLNEKRLERAKGIPDSQVILEKVSDNLIKARVKNYRILIDVEKKLIKHDCEDWKKRCISMQFCKHMGKLFLVLPKKLGKSLLLKIIDEIDEWEFKEF